MNLCPTERPLAFTDNHDSVYIVGLTSCFVTSALCPPWVGSLGPLAQCVYVCVNGPSGTLPQEQWCLQVPLVHHGLWTTARDGSDALGASHEDRIYLVRNGHVGMPLPTVKH